MENTVTAFLIFHNCELTSGSVLYLADSDKGRSGQVLLDMFCDT